MIYILGNLAKGKTANTLKLSFPALNASMEVPYDEANMSFKFLCGQYLCDYVEKDEETGDETTSYIYSAIGIPKKEALHGVIAIVWMVSSMEIRKWYDCRICRQRFLVRI